MPSLAEQILQRVVLVLQSSDTAAEERVERGRTDTPAIDAVPNLNVRRAGVALEPFASEVDAMGLEFTVECWTKGEDWEAEADALHLEVHAALMGDAALKPLVRSLRCTATDSQHAAAEVPLGRIAATYRAQALVSQRDLTRNFNT